MNFIKYIFKEVPKPSITKHKFKLLYTFRQRANESAGLLKKYMHCVPVVVEKSDQTNLGDIKKTVFLAKRHVTFKFLAIRVRKLLAVASNQKVYFYINNKIVPRLDENMEDLYNRYKHRDDFLYVTYA